MSGSQRFEIEAFRLHNDTAYVYRNIDEMLAEGIVNRAVADGMRAMARQYEKGTLALLRAVYEIS
jgi:hypothetical protein